MKRVQKGHVTLKWYAIPGSSLFILNTPHLTCLVGISVGSPDFGQCGNVIVAVSTLSCECRKYIRGLNYSDSFHRYVVDAADKAALPVAKEELHALLEKPVLDGIPLLVLGNKSDLPNKLSVDELIETLSMKAISHREVSCYGISAKEETNLDAVLEWLINKTAH